MRKAICTALIAALPVILQAQALNGDARFPVLNQIRWDMNRESILNVCASNNVDVIRSDSAISFDMRAIGFDARACVRFKKKSERPWVIEVKFREVTQKLVDTLVNHLTRTTGESPLRGLKEKSLLLITVSIELAVWKTKSESIRLIVGKRDKSIFDINLSIEPVSH